MKKSILTLALLISGLILSAQTVQVITNITIVKFAYPVHLKQSVEGIDTTTYLVFLDAQYQYIEQNGVVIIDDIKNFIERLEITKDYASQSGVIHMDVVGDMRTSDKNSFVMITDGDSYTRLESFQVKKLIKKLNKLI